MFHALRIVTRCLGTPTVYLPIISGIQPAELCQLGATLSLANVGSLDPEYLLNSYIDLESLKMSDPLPNLLIN